MAVIGVARAARSFRSAAWLGWSVDTNWADPVTIGTLLVVRPLAATMLLVLIFEVARGTGSADPRFAHLYVGTAFYTILGATLHAISFVVMDDRERYETIRVVATSPVPLAAYVAGRGLSSLVNSCVGAGVILAFGSLALGLPLRPAGLLSPLFLAGFGLGVASAVGLAIGLAGVHLVTARHHYLLGESVAGVLYLLSGAIFPIEALPFGADRLARLLPFTYWLEALRRPLVPEASACSPTLAAISDATLLAILAVSSAALGAGGLALFRACERSARRRGILDARTDH
ncbi:MAG: ABC transporter permease [Planctomycetales bacterium]|nr:ABC transporter permease [Planctomycetales bacterium]